MRRLQIKQLVIYLDMEGVILPARMRSMNNHSSLTNKESLIDKLDTIAFDPEAMAFIGKLLKAFDGKIILISAWQAMWTGHEDRLRQKFMEHGVLNASFIRTGLHGAPHQVFPSIHAG